MPWASNFTEGASPAFASESNGQTTDVISDNARADMPVGQWADRKPTLPVQRLESKFQSLFN